MSYQFKMCFYQLDLNKIEGEITEYNSKSVNLVTLYDLSKKLN